MNKFIYIFLLCLIFSCKSVDNWEIEPVLNYSTVSRAEVYVSDQSKYIELFEKRNTFDIKKNLSIEQLDELLKIEKQIALSARKVVSSWFDFNLELRQDIGFKEAYKGHYFFRKALDALDYSDKMKKTTNSETLKDSIVFQKINYLEGLCRLSIGEIAAFNSTLLNPDIYQKELKKLYQSMD